MKTRSFTSNGKMIEHARGLGTVSFEMVSQRAHEIALINRRTDGKPNPDDWQEAKRELTGDRRLENDPEEEMALEKRWDPVPGTRGEKMENVAADDEQTVAEGLVNEGVAEAEHEQMVEGTRESVRRDHELGDSSAGG